MCDARAQPIYLFAFSRGGFLSCMQVVLLMNIRPSVECSFSSDPGEIRIHQSASALTLRTHLLMPENNSRALPVQARYPLMHFVWNLAMGTRTELLMQDMVKAPFYAFIHPRYISISAALRG